MVKPKINSKLRTNPFEILEDFQDRDHESEDDSYEQATTTATSLKSRLQSMQKATAPAAELPMPGARVPAKRRQPRASTIKDDFAMRRTDFPELNLDVQKGAARPQGSWSKGVSAILAAKDLPVEEKAKPARRTARSCDYEELPDYELSHLDISRLQRSCSSGDDGWGELWDN